MSSLRAIHQPATPCSPRDVCLSCIAIVAIVAASQLGCSDDANCTVSADCFRGEQCIDGECVVPENNGSNSSNASSGDMGDNASNADGGGPNAGNAQSPGCVVDPFDATCEDDGFEPNENVMTFPPLLFDNQSWCTEGELLETQTSDPLSLCVGDQRDAFRLMIDNRTPDECITRQFTWKTEVRIETPCARDLLHIEPFYSNPATEDRCVDDDDFRCSWSEDGQTFTIQQIRQPDQLMDINLLVEPASVDDNVQIDYEVQMTITL